jgi:hypothetical protein
MKPETVLEIKARLLELLYATAMAILSLKMMGRF